MASERLNAAIGEMAKQDITFANCDSTWQKRVMTAVLAAADTRPAPAATDTGLVTVGYTTAHGENYATGCYLGQGVKLYGMEALVTRSQAEKLLAAERAENDEAYELGKRDGYSEAVQEIDLKTGGDGEYRYCTDHDPDRHTPDPASMIQRIAERFETLNTMESISEINEWKERAEKAEADNAAQAARIRRLEHKERFWLDKNDALEAKLAAAEKALETKSAANEALSKSVVESIDTEKRLREALELIADIDTRPYRCASIARAVLGGKPS